VKILVKRRRIVLECLAREGPSSDGKGDGDLQKRWKGDQKWKEKIRREKNYYNDGAVGISGHRFSTGRNKRACAI